MGAWHHLRARLARDTIYLVRCLIPILAGLCATSSCSLLFEASSDVEQRRDSGLRTDGALGTSDANETDARPLDVGVEEVTSDRFTRSPYVLDGLLLSLESTTVIFIATQGGTPQGVRAASGQDIMTLAPLAQSNEMNLGLFAYVLPVSSGKFSITLELPGEDLYLNVLMAAVTVKGAATFEEAILVPNSVGLPVEAGNLEEGELIVYSVGCLDDNSWKSDSRRLWDLNVDGALNSTGLMGVAQQSLDPQIGDDGITSSGRRGV